MTKFETNKTYSTRSICDSDMVISVTIAKRTAKTVTTTDGQRLRVTDHLGSGIEAVRPWGSYSMCPVIRAA